MMKTVGMFEAKTKFSEICQDVARTGLSVLITRRGEPFVQIDPYVTQKLTIQEKRARYMAEYGATEQNDDHDFEPPVRSRETLDFKLDES